MLIFKNKVLTTILAIPFLAATCQNLRTRHSNQTAAESSEGSAVSPHLASAGSCSSPVHLNTCSLSVLWVL